MPLPNSIDDRNYQNYELNKRGFPSSHIIYNTQPEKQILDETDSNITYIGLAPLGSSLADPVWQIKRLVKSGKVLTITWAGLGEYNQIWNNRASLTYS